MLWKKQRAREREEISEEKRTKLEESDNHRTYKEMISTIGIKSFDR